MNPFLERHRDHIAGTLSCFGRVIVTGTLPDIGHAEAMAGCLTRQGIRLFDFPSWAEALRNDIRAHAERLAEAAGVEVEFIRKYKDCRKEERVKAIIAERGDHPGLVHVFSAMESCPSFRPWHDKVRGRTLLKPRQAKCLHYYFYFIDEAFGLCYVRLPTWAPCRLQVCFNGHNWLARQLTQAGVDFQMADNACLCVADFAAAQHLADGLRAQTLHRRLERWAKRCCPVLAQCPAGYHWSFMQAGFATDAVFHQQQVCQPLYEAIVRAAVHEVKADRVAAFPGRKRTGACGDEPGNDFNTRIMGTRIRHHMGPASIKLYDKHAIMARIECTTNDVTFFKTHRTVTQRDGNEAFKLAPLRKNSYSLHDLRRLMTAANDRCPAFMAAFDNPGPGLQAIDTISRPAQHGARALKGCNLLLRRDHRIFLALARGEWTISGFRARDLRARLPALTPGHTSHLPKRLRTHGLIKKVGNRYQYYLTKLGALTIAAVLKLRETVILPTLAGQPV